MNSITARARDVRCSGLGPSVSDDHSLTLLLASKVIGVERTGEAPRSGSAERAARRVQTKRPARQCSSSHSGSYSVIRAGRMSVSHAAAGASNPSSCVEHRSHRVRALHPRIRQDPLPVEQKAQEIPRRHRLDLGAQPLDGVAVNAREQAPLAPFVLGGAGREPAAQGEALALQDREGAVDGRQRQTRANRRRSAR